MPVWTGYVSAGFEQWRVRSMKQVAENADAALSAIKTPKGSNAKTLERLLPLLSSTPPRVARLRNAGKVGFHKSSWSRNC